MQFDPFLIYKGCVDKSSEYFVCWLRPTELPMDRQRSKKNFVAGVWLHYSSYFTHGTGVFKSGFVQLFKPPPNAVSNLMKARCILVPGNNLILKVSNCLTLIWRRLYVDSNNSSVLSDKCAYMFKNSIVPKTAQRLLIFPSWIHTNPSIALLSLLLQHSHVSDNIFAEAPLFLQEDASSVADSICQLSISKIRESVHGQEVSWFYWSHKVCLCRSRTHLHGIFQSRCGIHA